jgi:H+/Cl- antiporter ClcA
MRNTIKQYKKQPPLWNRIMRWAIFVAILGGLIIGTLDNKKEKMSGQPQMSELEQVMSREDIKRQYELLAKEVLTKEKLKALEAQYQENKAILEAELEEIRKEKVGL